MTVDRKNPDHASEGTMSFGDHLEELRRRIFYALAAPLPMAVVIFFFSSGLIQILLQPLFGVLDRNNLPRQVQVLSPPEELMTRLKLSIIAALIVSLPWILWQAWRFISPGLYHHERRFVYFLIPGSALLTVSGVLLMYFAMLPLMLQVLVMFGGTLREPAMHLPVSPPDQAAQVDPIPSVLDVRESHPLTPVAGQMWLKVPENVLHIALEPRSGRGPGERLEILRVPLGTGSYIVHQYRLNEYIHFVLILMLAIVVAFQLPLVMVVAGWVGMVTADWLRSQRRYALLICSVVAAVITPADAISMVMMLIPLYLLYELGILLMVIAPASRVAGAVRHDGGEQ
jgi:sec-independent protein translocase protein TatC